MISDNLRQIKANIATAANKAGRDPQTVKLVAVSKYVPIERIQEAVDAGQRLFGENYLQEAAEKIERLQGDISWHFIGHLQSNKAKQAASLFPMVETVDRLKIARALDNQASQLGKELSILIQVNVGREAQKSGVLPEEAPTLLRAIQAETNLKVCGLMTMPPFFDAPEKSRPFFRQLKELADELASKRLFTDNSHVELSMGMSGDYEVAIEEGATIVRVGTALFGSRM
ncbi:YggS family pyridoxal phosphate-dependent enzyme [Desulfobulbus rhabdoformis]|uniref:YggS family pyridoxal phosphate-dependent enzyme n=1 Tax=Desulfobulbus rhabdoformis TaxID=34032 RepID=UPI001964BB5C|nr:YggS family pyridoxal phosphate-dependent enzyme [Desulfobulbus rhabdoformis]MBM9615400.1 YggS family pyridoxal phosphate-dependent enzyme [Desulfobulbus rhabdoformis]